MFKRAMRFISGRESLVGEARARSVAMLKTTHTMFHGVVHAVSEGSGSSHRGRVADIDKEINHQQREVRRLVFEHLAISQGRDIVEALRLVTVVIDIERIGDLSKNIEELFVMLPDGFDTSEEGHVFAEIESEALQIFADTERAFEHNDEEAARAAIAGYDRVARRCEGYFKEVLTETSADDCVLRRDLGLILLLRYVKRTCGHLKNVASAVVNPFDRIGFRPGVG